MRFRIPIGWLLGLVALLATDLALGPWLWSMMPPPHSGLDRGALFAILAVVNGSIGLAFLGPQILSELPRGTQDRRLWMVVWLFMAAIIAAVTLFAVLG